MRRYARPALIIALTVYTWLFLASAMMCYLTLRPYLFVFPYTQWLDAVFAFPHMLVWPVTLKEAFHQPFSDTLSAFFRHPLLWFFVGCLLGIVVLNGLIGYLRHTVMQPTLYGDSQWAGDSDYRAAGIKLDTSPFPTVSQPGASQSVLARWRHAVLSLLS